MSFTNFKLDVDADGIALVTCDMSGRSMNAIASKLVEELSAIVDKVANDAPADGLRVPPKGGLIRTDRANQMKLVDAVVPASDLVKSAKDWINSGGKAKAPWDGEGFRLPGGPVFSKGGRRTFRAGNAIYRRET